METVIKPIRSIIVFNPGAAGDFITALCLTQLYDNTLYRQTNEGRILVETDYFKHTSQRFFYQQQSIDWDLNQLKLVENTHYWLDNYTDLADQVFYIDYPDEFQSTIIEIYLHKLFKNDMNKFLERHLPSLHENVRPKVNAENALHVFGLLWTKSQKAWRKNNKLTALPLADFFDEKKCRLITQTLIRDQIRSPEKFVALYQSWMEKNQKMQQLFR